MRDLLFHFGITLGKRYTKKQKAWFLEEAAQEAQNQGWKAELLTHKTKLSQSHHLSIGNPKTAQWVLMAAYDTPSKLLLPKTLYTPFRSDKNLKIDSQNLILQVLLSFISFTGLYFVLKSSATYELNIQIPIWITSFILMLILFKMMSGFANKFNHNRNSASIALMLDLLKEASLKQKMALIFVDKGIVGIEGFKELRDMNIISLEAKTILLDCLASGEILSLACEEKNKDGAQILIQKISTKIYMKTYAYESSLNYAFSMFPSGMTLVAGDRVGNELVVRNTRTKKDYQVNLDRLQDIRNGLFNTIRGSK
ncbi:MAG: hypothetical protein HGB31_09730 [Erysipelotrichaceae bacterium]|jgi:hypothetical protein|nr:hypothetical protein [Erysipelotrichaceae bacterium]